MNKLKNQLKIVKKITKDKGKNVKETTVTFEKTNGKSFTFSDIKEITAILDTPVDGYMSRYIILAETPFHTMFTLKGFKESLRNNTLKEYLSGRIKDETKLEMISSIQVRMIVEKINIVKPEKKRRVIKKIK